MKTYLGDGVYGDFDPDQCAVVLTTENGVEVTNRIVLETEVLLAMRAWLKTLTQRYANPEAPKAE